MKRRLPLALTAVIAIAILVAQGCRRQQETDTGEQAQTQPAIPEEMFRPVCNDRVLEAMRTAGDSINPETFLEQRANALKQSLGFEPDRANEIHDCQALIIPDDAGGMMYGAFVTVWVTPHLKSGAPNQPVADIYAEDNYGDLNTTGPFPLRFKEGHNCVYLKDDGGWKAWIVQNEQAECAHITSDPDPKWSVHVWAHDQAADPEMPPDPSTGQKFRRPVGARIIDTKAFHYYIGLQCGPQTWCVLGVRTSNTDPGDMHGQLDARGDYQRLSMSAGASGGLKPSGLAAHIRQTDDALGKPLCGNYENGVEVGRIEFDHFNQSDPGVDEYKTKFGVPQNENLPRTLVLSLQCDMTGRWTASLDTGWRKNTVPYKHGAGDGMVRWAWSNTDEDSWVQCASGCCGVDFP